MPKITVETIHTNPLTRRGDAPVEVEHTDRVEMLIASGALREVHQPGPEPSDEGENVRDEPDHEHDDVLNAPDEVDDEHGDPLQD